MQPQNIHSGSYPDDTDVKVVELFRDLTLKFFRVFSKNRPPAELNFTYFPLNRARFFFIEGD